MFDSVFYHERFDRYHAVRISVEAMLKPIHLWQMLFGPNLRGVFSFHSKIIKKDVAIMQITKSIQKRNVRNCDMTQKTSKKK